METQNIQNIQNIQNVRVRKPGWATILVILLLIAKFTGLLNIELWVCFLPWIVIFGLALLIILVSGIMDLILNYW